jgi:phosphocarrier protein
VVERPVQIVNRLGLHARAAARLVRVASGFESKVMLACRGREVNAKSIMGVMLLAAGRGTELLVRCDGPDEVAAAQAVVALVAERFGEAD